MAKRKSPLIPVLIAVIVALLTVFGVVAVSGGARVLQQTGPVIDWAARAQSAMQARSYGWAKANFSNGVLTIKGAAPSAGAAYGAFDVARYAIANSPEAVGTVRGYDNAISVKPQ